MRSRLASMRLAACAACFALLAAGCGHSAKNSSISTQTARTVGGTPAQQAFLNKQIQDVQNNPSIPAQDKANMIHSMLAEHGEAPAQLGASPAGQPH